MRLAVLQNEIPSGEPQKGGAQYIELIGKTINVLETLSHSRTSLNLREIGRRTGLTKSTTHRILHSLVRHGYVEQAYSGGPFRLGLQLLITAGGVHVGRALLEAVRPFSRRLTELVGETAYVGVPRDGRVVLLEVVPPRQDEDANGKAGANTRALSAAAGRVIAAYAPVPATALQLAGQGTNGARAGRALRRWAAIEAECGRIRQSGYVEIGAESVSGPNFFAAALFDSRDAVCGSVCLGLPRLRNTEKLRTRLVRELKACCRHASQALKDSAYLHDIPW